MSTTTTPGATSAATPGVSGPDAEPAPDEGLRERKKRETRGRLHRVALELVVAHGLDHVTIEQIAGGADVSTRTFFNYYPSKEAAVVGADPHLPQRLLATFVARPADEDVLTSIEAVMRERIAPLVADPGLREQRSRAFAVAPILVSTATGSASGIERALVEAVATRLGVDRHVDPRPALLTGGALAVVRAAFTTPQVPLEETVTIGFAALRSGFGPVPPAEGRSGRA